MIFMKRKKLLWLIIIPILGIFALYLVNQNSKDTINPTADIDVRANSLLGAATNEKFGSDYSSRILGTGENGGCIIGGTVGTSVWAMGHESRWRYDFYFPETREYYAGAETVNHDGELRDLGMVHRIAVRLDGVKRSSFENPAADESDPQTGRVSLGVVTQGWHTIEYRWLKGEEPLENREYSIRINKVWIE